MRPGPRPNDGSLRITEFLLAPIVIHSARPARISNPELARDVRETEANPECGAKKLARREAGNPAGGKEESHNGTHGRNAQRDCHGADHPFAMSRNLPPTDVQVSLSERE